MKKQSNNSLKPTILLSCFLQLKKREIGKKAYQLTLAAWLHR